MATYLVSTPRGSVHAMAWQGFTPAECYDQLVALLAATFPQPEAAARCLAKPVFDPQREIIDWYADVQGPVRAFAELAPDEQTRLLAQVGELGTALLAHAQKLQAEAAGSSQRALGGHLLEMALRYPDDTCLYLIGDQPVITCWGFGPTTAGAQPQDISRLTGAVPVAQIEAGMLPATTATLMAETVADTKRAGCGWLWLLPLLFLTLLLAFCITSWCGRPPLLPLFSVSLRGPDMFCPPVNPALEQAQQHELELIALLDDLRAKANLCTKTPGFSAATAPAIPPESPKEALVIPENAAQNGDLSFLSGVWECNTGLLEATTSTPISVLYTFDDKGTGYVAINSPTKGLCKGEAKATISTDGLLSIETGGRIDCPTGNPFSGQSVQCRDNNGQAQCSGHNQSAAAGQWKAVFLRR